MVFGVLLAVRLRRLVRGRAHAVDPLDLHPAPGGVLLDGDPADVRPGHRRPATSWPRSSASASSSPGVVVAAVIAVIAVAWRLGLHSVLVVLDHLRADPAAGRLHRRLPVAAAQRGRPRPGRHAHQRPVLRSAIIGIVAYLAVTKADVIDERSATAAVRRPSAGGLWQTVAVVGLLLVLGCRGIPLAHVDAAGRRRRAATAARDGRPAARRRRPARRRRRPRSPGSVTSRRSGRSRRARCRRSTRGDQAAATAPSPRPRDRLGRRGGPPQAAEQGGMDGGRREDRQGAARDPGDHAGSVG